MTSTTCRENKARTEVPEECCENGGVDAFDDDRGDTFMREERHRTWKAAMRLLEPISPPNYTDSTDTEFDSMTISSIRRF